MRNALHRILLAIALLVVGASSAWAEIDVDRYRTWFNAGQYREVLDALSDVESPSAGALRLRFDAQLATGAYSAAETTLAALERSKAGAAAEMARAELDFARSEYAAAEPRLRKLLRRGVDRYRARYLLGACLRQLGRGAEANAVLDVLADEYLEGRIKTADDLTYLGYALWWTGHFKNANEVFSEALDLDPEHVAAEIAWGRLFASKSNYRDADKSFREALKRNPNSVDALVGMALIDIRSERQSLGARERLAKARAVNEHDPSIHRAMVQVAIQDERWDEALEAAKRAVALAPKSTESWAALATVEFLRDDTKAFDEAVAKALQLDPKFARIYSDPADAGERQHRYRESVALYEKALELDSELAAAHAGLGIGYSRIGDDDKARYHLDRAYDLDSYNVRTYNLNDAFYDEVYRQFDWVEDKGIQYRVHSTERPIVERYVVPLLTASLRKLESIYRHVPPEPVHLEIFPDPELFAIRVTGLPRLGAHAVCFGRVIATRSPSEGDFNWLQVLYHELAHVFHLQLSQSRVPRWFTEGLAVHETRRVRESWAQPMDVDLYEALAEGRLSKVGDFNLAFTQARSIRGILLAYYQASVLVEYIDKRWGAEELRAMLVAWGKRKSTDQVVSEVLGLTTVELDRDFEAWLRDKKLASFSGNVGFPFAGDLEVDEAQRRVRTQPDDAEAHVRLAAALIVAGRGADAGAPLDRALELQPEHPQANLLAGQLALEKNDPGRARTHFETTLRDGQKSLVARMVLARLDVEKGRIDDAREHLEAALRIHPQDLEALQKLLELAHEAGDADAVERWSFAVAERNQSDVDFALGARKVALAKEDRDLASTYAKRALEIAPFRGPVHLALAEEAATSRKWDVCRQHLEDALRFDPNRPAQYRGLLARAWMELGHPDKARQLAKRALKDDGDEVRAKRVLEALGNAKDP